jgi:hypothetical protein
MAAIVHELRQLENAHYREDERKSHIGLSGPRLKLLDQNKS